ncbi:MAG: peptidoglycan DD-metalloendopeptidase family protein [Roseburia sp.]|nr:peptidoglycan DD-metalloendopeptidase family protein [Roseburia sp.]
MKKRLLRRWTAISLVLLLGVGMSFEAQAATAKTGGADSSASSSQSLKEAQDEKAQLEKALKEAQDTIADLKESKGNVEDKVAELNRQLIDISARITDLENQLTAKSEDIVDTQAELETAKQMEEQQYEDMKTRIQFMYENGQDSYLEVLLSSRDISEFLNSAEYIAQIQNYDRQKLTEYQNTVETITNLEAQLEQEYDDLQTLKETVENDKATVAAMMRQKESELAGLNDDIAGAQSEADYYAAEIQAQEELIAAIKRAEAEKAAAGIVENPYSGGAFVWPCPSSTRVTSDYGTRVSPTSGASSNHKGIDIGAAGGADIVAAADGTVKAASYSSAAGNYVMIDHGGGLYTVYMHASSLLVSPGQTVTAGQVIAKVGSTGISTGNHLHFGVSLNGSYVSPWGYLGG